jgi:hypothetical protein
MSHVAIINDETGVIENIAVVEEGANWTPPGDKRVLSLPHDHEVGIGWTHNKEDGTFLAPPVPELPEQAGGGTGEGPTVL